MPHDAEPNAAHGPPGRTRLADIARRMGVSEATVSRALRDDPQISERTRRLAQRAAEELGYVPNLAARSLASRQSRTLGVIVPDVTDPMYGGLVAGFESLASDRGYAVMLLATHGDPHRESRAMGVLRAHQVAGVALCGLVTGADDALLAVRPSAAVSVGFGGLPGGPHGVESGYVLAAEADGMRQLVHHLVGTGRRRLAYLAGGTMPSDGSRRDGIAHALRGMGWEPNLRDLPPLRGAAGRAGAVELVARHQPDAIVCSDDRAALVLMSALREQRIRVPDDVAVTGFDDIPSARLANPALTTVALPTEQMGERAARMLLEAISTGTIPDAEVLPVELVVRESTAGVTASRAAGERR